MKAGRRLPVKALCRLFGHSKQAFYKERKARSRKAMDDERILRIVDAIRAEHPRAGVRKLREYLASGMYGEPVEVGRDYLFRLARAAGLLVEPRRGRPHTTNSRHMYEVAPNLLKDSVLDRPYQAVVSDITYVMVGDRFHYLSLVTDAFTREIIGHCLYPTLETEGCLAALEMAADRVPEGVALIHHSDRGCQYASYEYRLRLEQLGFRASMTAERHCYENARAERVNGILKQEYFLDAVFPTAEYAGRYIAEVIETYNTRRLHNSLGNRTPSAFRASFAA